MLAYIPYMDPMGYDICKYIYTYIITQTYQLFSRSSWHHRLPFRNRRFRQTRAEVKQLGALLQSIVGQVASGR